MNQYLFNDDIVIKTEYFTISQDWEVPIPGFFILAPNRKLRSISEFTDTESLEFIKLLRLLRIGMKEVLMINDVYLFQNEDTLHDFHFWIFPRLDWMENFGRKIESVRPILNHAKQHMMSEENIKYVRDDVRKIRLYFEDNYL